MQCVQPCPDTSEYFTMRCVAHPARTHLCFQLWHFIIILYYDDKENLEFYSYYARTSSSTGESTLQLPSEQLETKGLNNLMEQ